MKIDSLFNTSRLTFTLILLILGLSTLAVSIGSERATAAPVTGFNAGNIIDDGIFYDKDSMTASQIQSFLNSQIKNCDTWGTKSSEYGGGTRAQYAKRTWSIDPPFVCLNNYHEDPNSTRTSYGQGGGSFSGGISAARIIYNAAQEYNINPKVLLVMLKKESAGPLTSDTWPLKSQYKYAMGYACPDSGPGYSANCSASKAGFYKQMMLAAWQLNYYREHPNDYRYKIGWNNIQYDVDPACGTKRVNIQNIATLSLYIYTPYTPNNAALAAYPGEAACGAYGNRNFYQFFKEWFGSPNKGNHGYSASRITGTGSSSTTMKAGETKTVSVRFKNTGVMPWYDISSYDSAGGRPTILQALHPNQKDSSEFNTNFTTPTRATESFTTIYTPSGSVKTGSKTVEPGEVVEFAFTITAPSSLTSGTYRISYMPLIPVLNGLERINLLSEYETYYINLTGKEDQVPPQTNPPAQPTIRDTSLVPLTNKSYNGVRITGTGMSSTSMKAGETKQVSVFIKNTGKEDWQDVSSVEAGNRFATLWALHPNLKKESAFNNSFATTTRATQRISEIYDEHGAIRPTAATNRVVKRGEVARITFTINAPAELPRGDYRVAYSLLLPSESGKPRIHLNPTEYYYISIT